MIMIPILDPDYRYRPTKTMSPVGKDREHAPGLSVCLYGLSVVIRLVCYGFRACRNTFTTGCAKNIPDPTSCHDGHYDLSVTVPSRRGFITDSAFSCTFFHDPMTFATNPRVVGSVTGSAPVEHLH